MSRPTFLDVRMAARMIGQYRGLHAEDLVDIKLETLSGSLSTAKGCQLIISTRTGKFTRTCFLESTLEKQPNPYNSPVVTA